MNNINKILFALLAIGMMACNSKKEEPKTTTHTVDAPVVNIPDTIRMDTYRNGDKITVNNEEYDYSYVFASSDELPIVKTSANGKYYDNTLKLTIKKGDVTVYSHTFTKASFKRFIPERLYPTIVLMGFNFNYNKQDLHDKFYFVASVGDPDDEEFNIPIDVSIDRNGELYLDKFIDTIAGSSNDSMEPKTDEGV